MTESEKKERVQELFDVLRTKLDYLENEIDEAYSQASEAEDQAIHAKNYAEDAENHAYEAYQRLDDAMKSRQEIAEAVTELRGLVGDEDQNQALSLKEQIEKHRDRVKKIKLDHPKADADAIAGHLKISVVIVKSILAET